MDSELLILRGTVGPLMVGHGAGELFGAFNAGCGIDGTAGFLESLGFRPGRTCTVRPSLAPVPGLPLGY